MTLLQPFESPAAGGFRNRIVMSAMTRNFADVNHCATAAMADYYERRAKDGVALILTEGVIVHPSGDGYNNVPHLQTEAQLESWKPITERVHRAGSKIFCQLWHCGRISHEDYTGGVAPVSSSSLQAEGINRQNNKPFGVPRALGTNEMPEIYEMFLQAARHARSAGFDGVQLHLGHGYLADQFFDARINNRDDAYGGAIENRCRFALELTEAVLKDQGADRVMVRISPSRFMSAVYDWPDLDAMLEHLIPAFSRIGLRMLDVSCARADYDATSGRVIRQIRPRWPHFLIGGASLDPVQAEREVSSGLLDMVVWGRFILANPDFVTRIREGRALIPFEQGMLAALV